MASRLIVIEDDKKIAALISTGLIEAGFEVDVVHDGLLGLKLLTTTAYAAAILDLMLPGLNGLDIVERARAHGTHTPILLLSAKNSVDDRIRGLQKGGDDYLGKPFVFGEILARVQALLRRSQNSATQTHLKVGDLVVDLITREVTRDDKKIILQPREFSLLELLMRNADQVVSKSMILEHVWNYHFDPQTSVIDVLVSRLRHKIDRDFSVKLFHTIRGGGYALRAP